MISRGRRYGREFGCKRYKYLVEMVHSLLPNLSISAYQRTLMSLHADMCECNGNPPTSTEKMLKFSDGKHHDQAERGIHSPWLKIVRTNGPGNNRAAMTVENYKER
jgi:hypothetical protein